MIDLGDEDSAPTPETPAPEADAPADAPGDDGRLDRRKANENKTTI